MTRTRFATATLLSALLSLPALAQVQVQQGGGLDANHQVGSGGYNRVENQVDYQSRNLLVTGNVAGGRAFRDSVGYTDPGAFRGTLGSDSLYSFQRDSIYSAPQALGIRAQTYGDRVIVTRGSNAIPGQFVGSGLGLNTRTYYDARSGVVTFRQNSGALVAVEGVRDLQDLTPSSNILATVRTNDGGLARIEASPLMGVQVNPLSVQSLTIDPKTNQLVRPNQPRDTNTQNQNRTDDKPADPNDHRLDRRYQNPDRTPETDTTDEDTSALRTGERVAPTLVLGNQLQQQLAAQALKGDVRSFDQEVQLLQDQMFGPALKPGETPQEKTGDPYADLLNRIREQAKVEQNPDQPKPPAGEEEGGTVPSWEQIFDTPDEAVQQAIKQAREDALRRTLGMVDENGMIDRETPLPTLDQSGKLGELMAALDYDLPRVQSLAGDKENRLNTLMTRGEQELAAEHFLAAENVYRQVLRESGDNPLAKAGLIHSQLGAGMIRSAAFNLRSLFSEHPELIALKYDAKLLPATERLTWLQRELQSMINDENNAAEPGLVLAYLGYQLDAEPLVTYGLGVAEARAPRDPLMPILRQIWLENDKPQNADKPVEQPAEQPEDANVEK